MVWSPLVNYMVIPRAPVSLSQVLISFLALSIPTITVAPKNEFLSMESAFRRSLTPPAPLPLLQLRTATTAVPTVVSNLDRVFLASIALHISLVSVALEIPIPCTSLTTYTSPTTFLPPLRDVVSILMWTCTSYISLIMPSTNLLPLRSALRVTSTPATLEPLSSPVLASLLASDMSRLVPSAA